MASQRQLVEELFEAALALQAEERDAFLDKVCSKDPELGRKLAELLIEDARAGSFLEHPALDFLGNATTSSSPTRGPGNRRTTADQNSEGQLKIGQILLNRFVIVRFIARGGMGEVYEVEDRLLQSVHVALKTILPHIAGDSSLRQRFQREVLLAREVTHPNLCPIYEIFHCQDPPHNFLFLTMKLLPGETLAARLLKTAPISMEEGLVILKQMTLGLAAIHAADIIHRDIKTTNIILDGAGSNVRLYITDFGLARAYESEATFTGKDRLSGTPDYMAPELFQGHRPSRATDLFAFGVVLHEVFVGEKPVPGPDNDSVQVSPRLASSHVPQFCVELITECVSSAPERRCSAFESALSTLDPKTARNLSLHSSRRLWTRRRLVSTAAGAIALAGGGVWREWDQLENLLHPLPRKRFVAVLNWPQTSDSRLTPMLTGVLSAIRNELIRVEAIDHDFFVISPEDVSGHVASGTQLKEICDPLGANLALAASGVADSKHFQLHLQLLNPSSSQSLREKRLSCAVEKVTSLPGTAVHAAATLLNVNSQLSNKQQIEPGTQSPAAYAVFQSAEALKRQPNDAGLDEAIVNYKQAVDIDPRYALAHAKLAQAYGRLYAIRRDPAALDLAMANSNVALTLNPNLVDGHLARALVLEQTGNEQGALDEISKAFALDPSNPTTLRWQAQIYMRLNRWKDAEQTYQRVLKERPNDWTAYNDLGFALHEQGKYQESIQAFRAASLAAPRSSMALSHLGAEYLQVGEFAEATESLKRSIDLDPGSADSVANMSLALRYQGKYEEALGFALKSVELNPADDANWLELGECYSSLHGRQKEAKAAYVMAAKEAEKHLQTDAADGPGWMLLALYRVKLGDFQNAPLLIKKAESLGVDDLDSQLYKARILELLGKREEALEALKVCFRKGATALQITPFPDLQSLRADPRYLELTRSTVTTVETN
jgi:serine/threonine protein kinase/tetratricopeptide (TPR) repeat protein